MKDPARAWGGQETIDAAWTDLGYAYRPAFEEAGREHDAFCALLSDLGATVHRLPAAEDTGPDSVYVHDPCTAGPSGLVLGRMGKAARIGEPSAMESWARDSRTPVTGGVEPPGTFEGGDLIWLDASTIVVGIGYRTNMEGAHQVQRMLDVKLIPVTLPHWNGPQDVLHLMSLISPLAEDLALIYPRLLPVPFLQDLAERRIETIAVSDDEFDTLGCNVLAVAPRVAIMAAGNPRSASAMRSRGVAVYECDGTHIALAGQGGPTCLTRPLVRGD